MQPSEFSRRNFLRTGSAVALASVTGSILSACGSAHANSSGFWNSQSNALTTVTLPGGALVQGYVASNFKPVFDEFVKNFTERKEIGASIAITLKGVPVLEAWGGYSDATSENPSKPWQRDTVSIVFSCTKGATALCAHLLASRNQLDLNAPVSRYWPEFSANGKENVTVRMLLDHSAGLPVLRSPVPAKGWADWTYMTSRLAAEAPWWEPGSDHGYHANTYGWLVGEVVRRITGVSIGTYFAREIATPLGLDFYIGTPESVEPRIAPLKLPTEVLPTDTFAQAASADPNSLQALVYNVGDWISVLNSREVHKAEIPAANGITNAQSLAAMYAVLANNGAAQGTQLLPRDYVPQIGLVQSASHKDRTLLATTRFGLGYWNSQDNRGRGADMSFLIGARAYGHPGFGGSYGFADPDAAMSFGYTMNRMGAGFALNERGQSLIDAAYRALGYSSNKYGAWL
jgi:CubicO group peptidase (beta-lactamase class C family)